MAFCDVRLHCSLNYDCRCWLNSTQLESASFGIWTLFFLSIHSRSVYDLIQLVRILNCSILVMCCTGAFVAWNIYSQTHKKRETQKVLQNLFTLRTTWSFHWLIYLLMQLTTYWCCGGCCCSYYHFFILILHSTVFWWNIWHAVFRFPWLLCQSCIQFDLLFLLKIYP